MSDGSDKMGSAWMDGMVAVDNGGSWLRAVVGYIYCTGELDWAGRGEIGRGHFVKRYRYLSDGEMMPKFIQPLGELS